MFYSALTRIPAKPNLQKSKPTVYPMRRRFTFAWLHHPLQTNRNTFAASERVTK
jgi:hypothetical protein